MKELILDTAWKRSLKNPYTGEELEPGRKYDLHNNKTGKTYKDVFVHMDMERGHYSIPLKTFYIIVDDEKIILDENFMVFADSVN